MHESYRDNSRGISSAANSRLSPLPPYPLGTKPSNPLITLTKSQHCLPIGISLASPSIIPHPIQQKYNITTIFDLRDRKEREDHPSPQIPGIKTIWIACSTDSTVGIGAVHSNPKQVLQGINPATFVENGGVDRYLKLYEKILNAHKSAFKAVREKLKELQGGVLFHCTGLSSFLFS